MSLRTIRAVLGVDKFKIADVLMRAEAMYSGMNGHQADYSSPNPALPAFLTLIQNLHTSHQTVKSRTVGAAAARDVQRDLLWEGMNSERLYVQSLVRADPGRGILLVQNAGLVVAAFTAHQKALLTVTEGSQSGSIDCEANVALLIGVGTLKPNQQRCFNWQYTLDGKTFVSVPTTPGCKTVITGLPVLTNVGVRVSLTNMHETGPWSLVVTILVR
jgi:hypothetical protein